MAQGGTAHADTFDHGKLFYNMFASIKCLGITEIVLDNALKIRLELITYRNDNARERFYRLWWCQKVLPF